MVNNLPTDAVRSPEKVAKRLIVLYAVTATAHGTSAEEVTAWLDDVRLSTEITPAEARYLAQRAPSKQEIIDISWQTERVGMLLWCLGAAALPPSDEPFQIGNVAIPPDDDRDVPAFIRDARLRPDRELWSISDHMLDVHWKARDAALRGETSPGLDREIIQERHHAINWVTGYNDLAWDDVTTDT